MDKTTNKLDSLSSQIPSSSEIGYDEFGLKIKVPQYKQRELQEDSVFSRTIRSNTITVGKIAPGAVTVEGVADGAITEVKISDNAITAPKIGANEIITNSANIADAVITAAKIHDINADTITAGVITGIEIQTATTGLRTILSSNNVKFYDDDVLKGLLQPDSVKSVVLGTASSFFVGDLIGNYNVEITSGGSIHMLNSDQNLRFGSGFQMDDDIDGNLFFYTNISDQIIAFTSGGSIQMKKSGQKIMFDAAGNQQTIYDEIDGSLSVNTGVNVYGGFYADTNIFAGGDITNNGDIQCGGKFISSDGSGGVTETGFALVTWVTSTGFTWHNFDFKDGLVTDTGSSNDETF